MGISSEVKDEMFIRTIGLSIFQSDGEDSDSQRNKLLLEIYTEFLKIVQRALKIYYLNLTAFLVIAYLTMKKYFLYIRNLKYAHLTSVSRH